MRGRSRQCRSLAASEALEARRHLDASGVPEVNFQIPALSPAESAGTVNLNLLMSAAASQEVVVQFTVGGTATTGIDYTIGSSVIIPIGATSAPLPVSLIDDALDEANETIVITLGPVQGATVGAAGSHTMTIADNDLPPTIRFTSASESIEESLGNYSLGVTLSAPSGRTLLVPVSVSGGTASSGVDYTVLTTTITIPPGSMAASANVLNIVDDTLTEPNETINLQMGSVSNATTTSPTTHTVTILASDQPPPPTAPTVVETAFEFNSSPQRIRIRFSESVQASLSTADLAVKRMSALQQIPTSAMALSYDTATNDAYITFPGLPNGALPDGNYRVRVYATGVTDVEGTPLALDAVGELFFLNGDATRDRIVNLDDFARLAANFNAPGDFSTGDFNYSGVVEIGDFAILAANFNRTRPAPTPPARYTAENVPLPTGGILQNNQLYAADLNDSGVVVGTRSAQSGSSSIRQWFTWSSGQSQVTLGPNGSAGSAINNLGQIAGSIINFANNSSMAFGPNSGPNGVLGNPDFGTSGKNYGATDLNDIGNIVGNEGLNPQKGVRWLGGAGTYEVIVQPGSLRSINNLGEMTGYNGNALYFGPGSTSPQVIAPNAFPSEVTDSGLVGIRYFSGALPGIWHRSGSVFELEAQPGIGALEVRGLNDAGTATISGNSTGYVTHEGMIYPLSGLIDGLQPNFNFVEKINDQGQIILLNTIFGACWLLTPIPGSGPAAPPIAPRNAAVDRGNDGSTRMADRSPATASSRLIVPSATFSNDLIARLADVL